MTERLALGCRRAATRAPGIFGGAGTELRGHEYHRSTVSPSGDGLELTGRFGSAHAGVNRPTLFASYLHQHLAATPELAERFVAAASWARGDDGHRLRRLALRSRTPDDGN